MDGLLINILNSIYGGSGEGLIATTVNALSVLPQNTDQVITAIADVMKPIGSVMVCIYFLMALMDKVTAESFTTDHFIKLLIKLVFSIVVLDNIANWSLLIMQFGTTFTAAVAGAADLTEIRSLNAESIVEQLGFMQMAFTIAMMLIPWAATLLVRVAIYFLTYGRAIEIGVRAAFSPLGCADLINGGANSNGFRYIKKMLAISVQGGIMLIVVIFACNLVNSMLMDTVSSINPLDLVFIGKYLGCLMSMVGMMAASKTIANDVIGA